MPSSASMVCASTNRAVPACSQHDDAGLLQLGAQEGMLGHLGDHLPHPRQQPAIVQGGLADLDAVPVQLPRLAAQPGRLRERPHRNRAVRRSHAAHLRPG